MDGPVDRALVLLVDRARLAQLGDHLVDAVRLDLGVADCSVTGNQRASRWLARAPSDDETERTERVDHGARC